MSAPVQTAFRLSVWRPASFPRSYMNTGTGSQLDSSNHQEVIYTWDAGSQDILGTSPDAIVARIRSDFEKFFDARRDPASRSVIEFRDSVSELLRDENLLSPDLPETLWSDSLDVVTTPDGELNLRVNTVLGVLRHFLWIADVFHSVPSASVLIR